MKFHGAVLASALSVSVITGCTGTGIQPPAVTQNAEIRPDRAGSWMAPEAKGEDLLYASSSNIVTIYAYPTDKVVGKLTGFGSAQGLCSDKNGNVWVTDSRSSQISEYPHAGTKPIAILSDQNEPVGCAVDPNSGNLAIANYDDNVFIYPQASGTPTEYIDRDFYTMQFCIYDASGNLYINGYRGTHQGFEPAGMLWLSSGGTRLQRFKLEGRRHHGVPSSGGLQWDGKNVVIGYGGTHNNVVYRVSDSGPIAKVVKKISLTAESGFIPGDNPLIVYKGNLIGMYDVNSTQYIAWWRYPEGGTPVKQFSPHARYYAVGLTLSVASSR